MSNRRKIFYKRHDFVVENVSRCLAEIPRKKKECTIFVLVMRLSSFESQRALRGERKATHPTHNRCPINFVVGGLPLTATITVVKGCWRPSREDVRARSFSSLSQRCDTLSGLPAASIVIYTQSSLSIGVSLSFCRSLSSLLLFFSFSARPSSTIVSRDAHATTHYMRTINVRSLEISSFVSVEMQRRSFSLLLVLCSLGTVLVGDVALAVAILVTHERSVATHSM